MIRRYAMGAALGAVLALLGLSAAASPAQAAAVWGSSALGELTGSRDSGPGGGVYGTKEWANGGFDISWDISFDEDTELWTYVYEISVNRKQVSHLLLEVTETEKEFLVGEGSDDFKEIKTWEVGSGGNPLLPNDLYGGKFDYGGINPTYTLVTDRAPVYGVFYAKDGKTGGQDVVAWSNALSEENYQTDESLTSLDFIVRPDGQIGFPDDDPPNNPPPSAVPEPLSATTGLIGLLALTWSCRRRR